jgi:hypothetical protein
VKTKSKIIHHLLAVSALLLGSSLTVASPRAQTVELVVADARGSASNDQLKALDLKLHRLEEFTDSATTPTDKTTPEPKLEPKLDDANDKVEDVAQDTAQAAREMSANAGTPSAVAISADIAAYKINSNDPTKAEWNKLVHKK